MSDGSIDTITITPDSGRIAVSFHSRCLQCYYGVNTTTNEIWGVTRTAIEGYVIDYGNEGCGQEDQSRDSDNRDRWSSETKITQNSQTKTLRTVDVGVGSDQCCTTHRSLCAEQRPWGVVPERSWAEEG